MFHKIAIWFIALYIIELIPWNKYTLSGVLVASMGMMLFLEKVLLVVSKIIGKGEKYWGVWFGEYSGGVKTMIMYGLIFAFAVFFYYKGCKEKTKDGNVALGDLCCLFAASIMLIKAQMMIRIMITFLPFMAVGFTELLCDSDNVVNEIGMVL